MQNRLTDPKYMAHPFGINEQGVETSQRREHIREQIRQVLFTNPGERVFRLDFGAGLQKLIFDTNNTSLWDLTRQRLFSSLSEVLRGEVDPSSIEIERRLSQAHENILYIRIAYRLATINRNEEHLFEFSGSANG